MTRLCSQVFKNGLLDAIDKTHAWVVTGGTNSGVMGLVGKTMSESPPDSHRVCLGIATWGIVKNHEDFGTKVGKVHKYEVADKDLSVSPVKKARIWDVVQEAKSHKITNLASVLLIQATWRTVVLSRNARKKAEARKVAEAKGVRAPLDPYHSHFLFADAGDDKVGEFGHEIETRTHLEEELCQGSANAEEHSGHCVMILLVVGGGPNTLKTVIYMLEMRRPVVILAHSGGAAYDIYEYMMHDGKLPTNDIKPDPGERDGGNKYKARQAYCEQVRTDLPRARELGEVRAGLYNHPLITFFGTEDLIMSIDDRPADAYQVQSGFDTFILDAILSNVKVPAEALMHAVTWRDPELVRRQLEVVVKSKRNNHDVLTEVLLEALCSYGRDPTDRSLECIRLLIGFGAEVKDIEYNDLFNPVYFNAEAKFLRDLADRHDARQNGGMGFIASSKKKADAFALVMVEAGLASDQKEPTASMNRRLRLQRRVQEMRMRVRTRKKSTSGQHIQPVLNHRFQSFSFFVLETLGSDSGYRTHLRARTALNMNDVMFTDLMLWSVVAGHYKLSRELWLHTGKPLRCALISRRLCYRLKALRSMSAGDELMELANEFESWAVGLLNTVDEQSDALEMLTCVEARRDPHSNSGKALGLLGKTPQWVSLWKESVLDEAAKSPNPSRRFLSQPHCQYVLSRYFVGSYRGSQAAIPVDAHMFTIAVNSLFHFLNLFCLGMLPEPIKTSTPRFPTLLKDSEEADDVDDDDDDEVDDVDVNFTAESMDKALRRRRCFSLKLWTDYFLIPKVKFTMHAMFNFVCLTMLVLFICLPRRGVNYDEVVVYDIFEITFWIFYLGRCIEEFEQITSQGIYAYLSHFWNVIDAMLFLANSCALGMRIVAINLIWVAWPYRSEQMESGAMAAANYTLVELGVFQERLATALSTEAAGSNFQIMGFILLAFRSLEICTYHPGMGQTTTILFEMVSEASQVIVMMMLIVGVVGLSMVAAFKEDESLNTYITGFAAAVGEAQLKEKSTGGFLVATKADMFTLSVSKDANWLHPWAFGVWATLGESENALGYIYEMRETKNKLIQAMGLDPSHVFYIDWLPLLIYISTFVMTIFLGAQWPTTHFHCLRDLHERPQASLAPVPRPCMIAIISRWLCLRVQQ